MTDAPFEQRCRWHPVDDAAAMPSVAAARVLASAARAIAERGRFLIVLAGGTTPRGVYGLLRAAETDWSAWHVYYGDERTGAVDDPDRNSRMAALAWLDHVPIRSGRIHPMETELGTQVAADRYALLLEPVGDFDLVLLGLGEDGHTASLFPDHDLGQGADAPAAMPVFDAPKPPPERVSLSAMRLSRTREVIFVVAGEGKRDAVARWRSGEAIPASAIKPEAGVDVIVEAALLRPPTLSG